MKTIDDFAALHRADDPLVLFNVWDAGSAAAVAEAGAKAIATGTESACTRTATSTSASGRLGSGAVRVHTRTCCT